MNEEIYSGLKNAIEHGSSLESAVQSFINAGYNSQEVHEAAGMFSSGVISNLNPQDKQIQGIKSNVQNKILQQSDPIQMPSQNNMTIPTPFESQNQTSPNFQGFTNSNQMTPNYLQNNYIEKKKSHWFLWLILILLFLGILGFLGIYFLSDLLLEVLSE